MRKIILYIATSVDGYIARPTGDLSWLPVPAAEDRDYRDFYASIHTLLVGRKAYEKTLEAQKDYPYLDKETFVFAHDGITDLPATVRRVSEDAVKFVKSLKSREGGAIWLVGGAQLIRSLLEAALVDEMHLFLIPTLLGSGIPLFLEAKHEHLLSLNEIKSHKAGVAELRYLIQN
jgi:dihydrofolate reductase